MYKEYKFFCANFCNIKMIWYGRYGHYDRWYHGNVNVRIQKSRTCHSSWIGCTQKLSALTSLYDIDWNFRSCGPRNRISHVLHLFQLIGQAQKHNKTPEFRAYMEKKYSKQHITDKGHKNSSTLYTYKSWKKQIYC